MLFMSDFPRPARKGEFVSRTIAGETLLVHVRGRTGDLDSIFNLNETASFIWNRIDGQATFDEIVAQVCSEFEVDREAAEVDARQFIAALQEAGLVSPTGEG